MSQGHSADGWIFTCCCALLESAPCPLLTLPCRPCLLTLPLLQEASSKLRAVREEAAVKQEQYEKEVRGRRLGLQDTYHAAWPPAVQLPRECCRTP